jgi:phage tail sheath protein FI
MPEYLAPGVYVEEIDTGAKPIEGVSTSTAAMVGVTERGPVNVPILITSYGEFTYWFGGRLNKEDFSNPNEPLDANKPHCYLPHAVEGFFQNGGKRLYVTRILDTDGASEAQTTLFNRGSNASADTVLFRQAGEGTGVNPPLVYVAEAAHLSQGSSVRIGDGSSAEYRQLTLNPDTANTTHVALNLPLHRVHSAGVTVNQFTPQPDTPTLKLHTAIQPGDATITLDGNAATDITALTAAGDDLLLTLSGTIPTEYRLGLSVTPTSSTQATVQLDSPLALAHAANDSVKLLKKTWPDSAANKTNTLASDARAGDSLIFVDNRNNEFHTTTDLVIIDSGAAREVRRIGAPGKLELVAQNAEDYPAGSLVEPVELNDDQRHIVDPSPKVGDATITVKSVTGFAAGQTVQIGAVGPTQDSLTLKSVTPIPGAVPLGLLTFTSPLQHDHAVGDAVTTTTTTPAISTTIGLEPDSHQPTPQTNDTTITLNDVGGLAVGQKVRITGSSPEPAPLTIRAITPLSATRGRITLAPALAHNHAANDGVLPVAKSLVNATTAGTSLITLNDRSGLAEGDVLRIDDTPNEEFAVIERILNATGVAPDAGNVLLAQPLTLKHDQETKVWRESVQEGITPTSPPAPQATATILDIPQGSSALLVSDGSHYAPHHHVRLNTPEGAVFYHELGQADVLHPALLTLDNPLERAHAAGSPLVGRDPLFEVHALDKGTWGNRLLVSVEDETSGLVAKTTLKSFSNATHLHFASTAGVEAGTVLELLNPDDGSVVGDLLKVKQVDRTTNYTVILDGTGLSASQVSGFNPAKPFGVRSREFRLAVYLLRQPDPALPSRNEIVLNSELFRNLSMDVRHSRYVRKVIGDFDGLPRLSDQRPDGESWYIRVRDLASDQATQESIRPGPETLVDLLPSGRIRPARQRLEGGDDSINSLSDTIYIGQDDPEPLRRTGLQTLRNVNDISIIACPGRVSATIQGALIDQCELLRYRFAVLDGPPPLNDTLTDVQVQRQQFDTKYAALYHPWLLIPDPFPINLTSVSDFAIPPSGHMLGIYARTDIERGVHKAPANEVLQNITGLRRVLNKSEQDILNPYPVNINVIRDFRHDNRGIRVYGARVVTSDPNWKYVNVRRLLIFLEASIDVGLQWVVFEPNAEPLWARVTSAIESFLTVVWRNGALEGTTPAEAFFVKCDRTTMTQADIDNGRLICIVGVAPVKPAEFVIVRIGLFTAHAQS